MEIEGRAANQADLGVSIATQLVRDVQWALAVEGAERTEQGEELRLVLTHNEDMRVAVAGGLAILQEQITLAVALDALDKASKPIELSSFDRWGLRQQRAELFCLRKLHGGAANWAAQLSKPDSSIGLEASSRAPGPTVSVIWS